MTELNLKYLSEQTGVHTKDMSDGYHSFGELYEWRHTLFMLALKFNAVADDGMPYHHTWWTENHHPDNDSMFEIEGKPAILVGIELPGMSVQFHMPSRLIPVVRKYADSTDHAPFYDGTNNPDAALAYLKDFVSE